VKVEALTTPMPDGLQTTTVFLTQLNGVVLGPGAEETSILQQISWPYLVLGLGSLFATIWFAYKLVQIKRLRHKGAVEHYREFTKVTVPQSTSAFSFFRNIFMGEEIQKDKEDNILAHELVHVKQWHSLDLLFFELARIVFWFNPLVYIYQNRVAELHEFIADERAVKHNKADHFEMLLSQAFHTQNISFVNQFFNRSLIKKRIVMLQKKKSKAVWQLKYVLLLPLVLGMLVYTSCESEKSNTVSDSERQLSLEERLQMLNNEIEGKDSLTESERNQIAKMAQTMIDQTNKSASEVNGWTVKAGINPPASVERDSTDAVAFAVIDEVPIFPGCENAVDKKQCFNEKIVEHIKKHFRYPEAAEKQGIQGRVSILFTIDTNGEISSIKKRGPSEILENEAVRIIERLPKMQPGKHKGETVNVPFAIPITFKLKDQAKDENEQTNSNKGEMKVGGILANKDNASLFIGKVTDEESMGIPGVTISVVGKNEDVISGFDGHFKIVVNEGETLKFQYIGLPNKLVRVDKKEFLIGLLEKANAENKS
jgi:TonB family protein